MGSHTALDTRTPEQTQSLRGDIVPPDGEEENWPPPETGSMAMALTP